jgi:hypothetical protein
MFSFDTLASPPPRVIAPPVDSQAPEDHPEQMVLVAASRIPPPLVASESDQIVIGPPFERRFTLAADKTLRFDLSTKLLFDPVTVMLAPAVKSLDAPLDVMVTGPVALIALEEVTDPPVMSTAPAAVRMAPIVDVDEDVTETSPELVVVTG